MGEVTGDPDPLRRHGVETEDTVGQAFDPYRHEALRVPRDTSRPGRLPFGLGIESRLADSRGG